MYSQLMAKDVNVSLLKIKQPAVKSCVFFILKNDNKTILKKITFHFVFIVNVLLAVTAHAAVRRSCHCLCSRRDEFTSSPLIHMGHNCLH